MTRENEGFDRRDFLKTAAIAGLGVSMATTFSRRAFAAAEDDVPSLAGKTIVCSAVGTDHYWDLKCYQGQLAEIERLGGKAVGVDAGRSDAKLVSQLQNLVSQKPDGVIQMLGTLSVIDGQLEKIRAAGIPLVTCQAGSRHSVCNVASNDWVSGAKLALQMIQDIGYKGNILVFNGFYGVTPCAIRYDMMRDVIKHYPEVKIIEPELRDIVPNTVQDAYAQMMAMLNKFPNKGDIAGVYAAWDQPQLGAAQAIMAAGRTEVKTYAYDGSPEVLALMQEPDSAVTGNIAAHPELIGRTAVQMMARHLAGQQVPLTALVDDILVVQSNVGEVQKQLGQI
jgi:ribose transport system substrate-binding protein